MTRAPKLYRTTKPVVRNQAAVDRHCEQMADNLASLSKQIRAKNAAKRKAAEIESPDEGEREHDA